MSKACLAGWLRPLLAASLRAPASRYSGGADAEPGRAHRQRPHPDHNRRLDDLAAPLGPRRRRLPCRLRLSRGQVTAPCRPRPGLRGREGAALRPSETAQAAMPGPGEGPEYELAELTPEQADGGSDGVSRGSTRNDKLEGRREVAHVTFFEHRLFDWFGSNAFVAFLHVYFVLGASLVVVMAGGVA